MAANSHGFPPSQDFRRVHRATEPRLRHPIPALNTLLENANATLDKIVATMNRGGSDPRNPILSGLGVLVQIHFDTADALKGIWLYQDRRSIGANLRAQSTIVAPGVHHFPFLAGSGTTVAGSPATGAKKNFIRVQSAFGTFEREFYIKTKDADIIALEGQPALDPQTLLPVEIVFEIIDDTRPFRDIAIDFFVSWNDEFQKLHNASNPHLDPGFLKAYGGAKFVSFFDTNPGVEGTGVQVDPVTQSPIEDTHTISVENTAGLKEITVRFRSKQDSLYFVDCPILIRLVPKVAVECLIPRTEPCVDLYLKMGSLLPADTPGVPSVPLVQVVAGTPGMPLAQDLLILSVRAAIVGSSARLIVRRWKWVVSTADLTGGTIVLEDELEYIPLSLPSSTPFMPSPYLPPRRLTIALGVLQETSDGIAFYTVQVEDDDVVGKAILFAGPHARDISFFPVGAVGGGPICAY